MDVHGVEGNRKIEIVMRGLAVVDTKSIEQDQRLLKAAAAQDDIGLRTAGAALLEKDGRVLAEKIERCFGGELFSFEGQYDDGARRLCQGHRSR